MKRQGPDNRAANRGGLNRSDKTLRTPAFNALIDVMHEARLVRFGAGKAHLAAAFHAIRVFVEALDLALWHCPPHEWLMAPGKLRFHNWKVAATNRNLPFTHWTSCGSGHWDVRLGSFSEVGCGYRNFCFTPVSGLKSDIAGGPFRAINGHRCCSHYVVRRDCMGDYNKRGG
jgi:hypothetical protein